MKEKIKLSGEDKLKLISNILDNSITIYSAALNYGICESTIRGWIKKYNESGAESLNKYQDRKQYSKDLKIQAVEDVIFRGYSKNSVLYKYEISGFSVLRRWIEWYNSGKQLEDTSARKVGTIMTSGRKTTLEERIEIVQYTIARSLDYKSAIKKFSVSYQQVYSWVNKYKKGGPEALRDNRGRKKEHEELTENEKLKLRIKELEARNEFLEMESAIEKKLEELQRRYGNIR